MTYDNGVLPHSLFVAYSVLGEDKYLEVARQTSEFLLEHGFIDRIVRRKDLKSEIARTVDYCGK